MILIRVSFNPSVADINILCFASTNGLKDIVGAIQGRIRIFLFAIYILHSFKFSDILKYA